MLNTIPMAAEPVPLFGANNFNSISIFPNISRTRQPGTGQVPLPDTIDLSVVLRLYRVH
ncbi:hypothetical protein [Kineobactrum sediminis]|uniref:hypothetical protein n=1 Tax=Kineobactrum sediminis TaxID=1905677 RepID=UPI001390096A|nr:hypothetical protein [Kineobactrum sediminis]